MYTSTSKGWCLWLLSGTPTPIHLAALAGSRYAHILFPFTFTSWPGQKHADCITFDIFNGWPKICLPWSHRLIPESTSRYMSFCKRYFAKVWTSSVQSRHFQPDLLVAMEEKAAAWNCEVQPISWQRSPDNRRDFPSLGSLSFSKIHS